MIKNINLKFGSAPNLDHASIAATPVTVFVGPNNSGKSIVLVEVFNFCNSGQKDENSLILKDIEFDGISYAAASQELDIMTLRPNIGEAVNKGHIIVGKKQFRSQVLPESLLTILQNPNENINAFCEWYLKSNITILDGSGRIRLINEQPAGDLQNTPQTSFQTLFCIDDKRNEVRRIIHDAFGSHFTIDATKLGSLRVKLSPVKPKNNMEECGIHKEAIDFQSKAFHIGSASDGVKAFTGMITEIIAGDPKILLIDEPEAFLHPSLSHKLGKEIATATAGTNKRILVSTHSSHFVMGCIQSSVPVNIVRLTYKNGIATARILENSDVLTLMRDPLLRSTGVLEGLFYENVVVTEGDTDRAFYQEINERLLQFKPEWGIPNCLFLNAQNKQTIRKIIKPLRELGIPAAGIVDIDVLKEGGKVWSSFLKSGFVPEVSHIPLSQQRNALKDKLVSTGNDMKIHGGVDILNIEDKEAANNLFDQLDQYGLFTVRSGEVESWLKTLNISGHGAEWLIKVFEEMGDNPDSESYLKPATTDVWKFIKSLKIWFDDPTRRGIPS